MTHFARYIPVLFVLLGFCGANMAYAQQDTGGHGALSKVKVEAIVTKVKQRDLDLSKETGLPADLLAKGYNPGCPDDIRAKLENRVAQEMKALEARAKERLDQGTLSAEKASCFNLKGSQLITQVQAIWNSVCVSANAQNIGSGGLKAMGKCLWQKTQQQFLKKMQKDLIDKALQKACHAVSDLVKRQLDQCIQVGFRVTLQKPQFRGLNQCLINLRAVGNININASSFKALKTSSSINFDTDLSSPMWDQWKSTCGGVDITDFTGGLLTSDCWEKKPDVPVNNGVASCGELDPAILAKIAEGQTAGDTETRLKSYLVRISRGSVAFKTADNSKYEIDPVCYGFSFAADVCEPDANGVSPCPQVAVENFCCDPSTSSCADAVGVPICPGTCCDKTLNKCDALGVAQCASNMACIGNMEKVFAYNADGSKIDTGKTAGDEQLNPQETSVWTMLKTKVKPDREIAGKVCCSTPWCNLCPQDIVREDYRLQGKSYGFGPGVILPEGMAPPARNKCMPWRHLPAEVMQFIFENRTGDKYATHTALSRMIKDKQDELNEVGNGGGLSVQDLTEVPAFKLIKGIFQSGKMARDRDTANVIGMGQMLYQPLFAEGMPVNYAKVMVDGEVQDVGLCSDLDYCPIDYVAPTTGGSGGISGGGNTTFGGACYASTSSYCTQPDVCAAGDVACYNRCCGNAASSSSGANTNVNNNSSDGSRGGGTVVNTDGGGSRGGTDTGSSSGGTTTNGPSGGGATDTNTNIVNEEAPKNDAQMIVPSAPVNPTTQGAESPGIVETLKGLF